MSAQTISQVSIRKVVVAAFMVAAVAALALTATARNHAPIEDPEAPSTQFDPVAFTPQQWELLLGGDGGAPGTDELARLDAATDLSEQDAPKARSAATAVAKRELTGTGHATNPTYWPYSLADNTQFCTNIEVLATSVFSMPVPDQQRWVKALVVWDGTCPFDPPGDPNTLTIYMRETPGGWEPVRELQVPGANATSTAPAIPTETELTDVPPACAPTTELQIRLEVAYALEVLCRDALDANNPVTVTDAYRTPQDQQRKFQAATKHYGNEDVARRHVAYSDGDICMSAHCSGTAVDIATGLDWLSEVVSCTNLDGKVTSAADGQCPPETVPARRFTTYALAQPQPANPTHFVYMGELAAPSGPCQQPGTPSPTEMISSIWGCMLVPAGLPKSEQDIAVSFAVEVARCASGWDPAAVAYGGRFIDTPHPDTGRTHDEAGLFALSRPVADAFVPGGYGAATSAGPAAEGAARIWLTERAAGRSGWDPFPCVEQ